MIFLKAFIVGGLICAVGQILIDKTKLTPARILVTFVVLGVFLQLLRVYEPLVNFAGAGATVPLTGFGYNLCKGAAKAVSEQGFLGIHGRFYLVSRRDRGGAYFRISRVRHFQVKTEKIIKRSVQTKKYMVYFIKIYLKTNGEKTCLK